MDDAPAEPTIRTTTKRQRKTITDLANKGLNSCQIARATGLHSSSIRRFLDKIQPEFQALTDFKANRADALATLQGKNLAIQERLLTKLEDEGLLAELTPTQLTGIIFALNSQHGTLFDKERLERGQSSYNISTVSRMIDTEIGSLYKPHDKTALVHSAPKQGAVGTEDGPVLQPGIDAAEAGGRGE
jgi:hypothetical protein